MYPKDQEEQEQNIINVASPSDAALMPAANYQISGPLAEHKPDTKLRDAAIEAGAGVGGKAAEGALFGSKHAPAGSFFEKGIWGLGKGAGASGAAFNPAAAGTGHSLLAGPGAAAAGNLAGASAAAPGLMAAAGPVALGIGSLLALKSIFKNKGGSVGPLSAQYHDRGDEVKPWGITRRHVQSSSTGPGGGPSSSTGPTGGPSSSSNRTMTYGEAYDKAYDKYGFDYTEPKSEWGKSLYHGINKALSPSIALDAKIMQWMHNKKLKEESGKEMTYREAYDKAYGKYGFDHMEPESEWGKSLYHGFNKALSPSIALDAKIMQWMHNKEMRDAGVPGFNQGGSIGPLSAQYKEGGGEAEDPWGITRRPVQTSSTITPTYYSGRRPPWAPRGVLSQGASKHGPLRSDYSSRLGDNYSNMKPDTNFFYENLNDQPQSTKIEKKETIEYKN